ncbi:unnamed protein product [Protopolystoma xenopodis]|uniref:Calcineurin-like phosphoesterase domain-containing protein n=1 Tax=Protopolystoma xenopodis TaxID=117903 RepID=A0A448X3Q8_9PLAT|nr:unnamed protein product [Protopolystoma xenopodis]
MSKETDLLKILVSTDNHLGFGEKDGLRGTDSFITFEEILSMASRLEVDLILLAGDLFHDSRPSLGTLNEAMRLIRLYCSGERPISFELLSEARENFAHTTFPTANYLDANLSIKLPIFTIHGNHDDPSGAGSLCAADLLHTSGLLNLFGKNPSIEQLKIRPLLIRKGDTNIAIYGIGSVREERMHRLFVSNAVEFIRPEDDVAGAEKWFSLALIHQNRSRHGPTNYLPEEFLPNFLDLVIWGHEHECRVEPEWNATQNFYVVQPGSSVATALTEGESLPKAVAMLEIYKKEFKVRTMPTLIRNLRFDMLYSISLILCQPNYRRE